MATFKNLYMTSFREKWLSYNPVSLHSSNPQPLTLGELETLTQQKLLSLSPDTSLGYGSDSGYLPLREALSEQLYPELGTDNILTCAGAQEGIYITMHALLEADDKVIAFTPIFEPLISIAQQIGCDIELLALDSKNEWKIDLQALAEAIDDKTKMVIINYPHNPTGALLSEEELQVIISLCEQHNVWLFSDEVFRGLEHNKADRLPPVAEKYHKGVSLGVLSKAFGVPAIRVGWLACQDDSFLKRCKTIKGYLSICNDQLGEMAAVSVVKHAETIFMHHRQLLVSNLELLEGFVSELQEEHQGIVFQTPKAGCTVFASLSIEAEQFAESLVKQAGLLVIPNKAFCTDVNAIRLGFGNVDYKKHFQPLIEVLALAV